MNSLKKVLHHPILRMLPYYYCCKCDILENGSAKCLVLRGCMNNSVTFKCDTGFLTEKLSISQSRLTSYWTASSYVPPIFWPLRNNGGPQQCVWTMMLLLKINLPSVYHFFKFETIHWGPSMEDGEGIRYPIHPILL